MRGEPSARRRFVDELLVQRTPRLAGVVGDYERVLRQRNGAARAGSSRDGRRRVARRLGRAAGRHRERAARRPDRAARRRSNRSSPSSTRSSPATTSGSRSRPQRTIDEETGGRRRHRSERFAAARWPAVRRREIERGITLVGPAPRRRAADGERPAGPRLREPRRVVVPRARAPARRRGAAAARAAHRGPDRDPRRRVRRARRAASAPAGRPRRPLRAGHRDGGGGGGHPRRARRTRHPDPRRPRRGRRRGRARPVDAAGSTQA